eukprot:1159469_1
MALYRVLVFMFAAFGNANGVETLYPNLYGTTYRCGSDEDCTIICNDRSACYHTEFYVFNHIVSILCTGIETCTAITIISTNVTTLNITATGYHSLISSDIIVDSTNTNVYTLCDADTACSGAKFFYQNQQSVTHICSGANACTSAVIHAATTIEFHADSSFSHTEHAPISVIWPTDTTSIQQSKWIQHSVYNLHLLFLANTDITPNITCLDDIDTNCDDDISIHLIYGTSFDQHCPYSTNQNGCMQSILDYEDEYDANTFHHRHYLSLNDTQTLHFQQNTIMTIDPYLLKDITFTSVRQDTLISIICIDCSYIMFNFSSIFSTAITVIDEMTNCQVLGSQTLFRFSYMPQTQLAANTYHLETTEHVILNGLQECAKESEKSSFIYLSNQTDVEINDALINPASSWCDHEFSRVSCDTGTIIYSSFGSDRTGLEEHGWSIAFSGEDQCIQFESTPIDKEIKDGSNDFPVWGIVLIIVCICVMIALVVISMMCYKKIAHKKERIRTMTNERQPGSIDCIQSGSVQRVSTKNLDMNEDDNEDGEAEVTEEDSLIDEEKEGDVADMEGDHGYHRQETDKHIAASAIDEANKGDISTAGTHGGDGEGNDEVRQWLETIEFSQYYDNFVKNGMNDLELIKTIENKDDLAYLGIELKGHQIAMMKKINELKKPPSENRKRAQTPYDSAAHLEVIGDDQEHKDKENEDQSIEQKEDIVLDNMLSEVLEMQKANPDKIHQMNVDAAVDQKENVSDSDESDHMYQKSENK